MKERKNSTFLEQMSFYSNTNSKRSKPKITSLLYTLTALQLGSAGHVHGHSENTPRAAQHSGERVQRSFIIHDIVVAA